jgi:hypothetical protein
VYSQQGYAPGFQPNDSGPGLPIAAPLASGQQRNIALMIVFGLLTCGIHTLWWTYKIYEDVARDLGRTDINPLTEVLLSIITCNIYGIYLSYWYPQRILEMQVRRGLPRNDLSIICLLLSLFGLNLVSHALMQSELNRIWASGR